jgi:hypothetical protein
MNQIKIIRRDPTRVADVIDGQLQVIVPVLRDSELKVNEFRLYAERV